MAKGGLTRLMVREGSEHRDNVNTENNKSMIQQAGNVVDSKEHRLVVDVPEELYWQFKTASGSRRMKMKQAIADALEQWIKQD